MQRNHEKKVDACFSEDDDDDDDGKDGVGPNAPGTMSPSPTLLLPRKRCDITLKHLLDHGRVSAGDVVFIHRKNITNPRTGVIMSDESIALGDEFRTSCTITAVHEFRKYIDLDH